MTSNNIKKEIRQFLDASLKSKQVEVKVHKDPSIIGIQGKITMETKYMIHMETDKGEKKVSKINGEFTFDIGDEKFTIDGKLLLGLPKDRKKRKMRSW